MTIEERSAYIIENIIGISKLKEAIDIILLNISASQVNVDLTLT